MEYYRKLEITLVSADNLPDVRCIGVMKVYAKVSIDGESETTMCSNVDMEGETNPRWNFTVDCMLSESAVQLPGVNLVVKLLCKRTLGDRFIGEVKIPVKSLFDMGLMSEKILSYTVAGTRDGTLNISYRFGEKVLVQKADPVWKKVLAEGLVVLVSQTILALINN